MDKPGSFSWYLPVIGRPQGFMYIHQTGTGCGIVFGWCQGVHWVRIKSFKTHINGFVAAKPISKRRTRRIASVYRCERICSSAGSCDMQMACCHARWLIQVIHDQWKTSNLTWACKKSFNVHGDEHFVLDRNTDVKPISIFNLIEFLGKYLLLLCWWTTRRREMGKTSEDEQCGDSKFSRPLGKRTTTENDRRNIKHILGVISQFDPLCRATATKVRT